MLHQTLVSFQPFSSSYSSPCPLPSPSAPAGPSSSSFPLSAGRLVSPPPPYAPSSQVEMRLMNDMLSSGRDQGFLADEVDDVAWTADRGHLLGEDFLVDDLLDLRGLPESEEDGEVPGVTEASLSPPEPFPCAENEPLELYSDISLHETDAAALEWLSHFFDDCSKEFPSPPPPPPYFGRLPSLPAQNPLSKHSSAGSRDAAPSLSSTATAAGSLSTEALVPVKAKRSKRLRGSSAVWLRSGSLKLADSSPASSITTLTTASPTPSSSSSSSSSSSFNSYISYEPSPFSGPLIDDTLAPPKPQKPKKRGRKPKSLFISPAERRCTHCGVHKTPQWRAGPQGAKTLCNACGVRFKSGRLLPEYRPACSPTFVSAIHSNSHRKVLEMRRKKDEQLILVPFAPPVTSC